MGVYGWDLESWCPAVAPLPHESYFVGGGRMASNVADFVLASHVLEHVQDIISAMREIHRVLKPGGHLVAATPYASSDDAWDDPTHVRVFTQNSWHYFNKDLYAKKGHAGHYNSPVDFKFEVVSVSLIPTPETKQRMESMAKKGHLNIVDMLVKHERNIVQEMIAVLRKVE